MRLVLSACFERGFCFFRTSAETSYCNLRRHEAVIIVLSDVYCPSTFEGFFQKRAVNVPRHTLRVFIVTLLIVEYGLRVINMLGGSLSSSFLLSSDNPSGTSSHLLSELPGVEVSSFVFSSDDSLEHFRIITSVISG